MSAEVPQLTVGPSLADQAYGVLRDLITSGALLPAERVTERGLAGRLGVSPTPVREAISRLIHERLLVRVDGRTLQVAAPSLRGLREMSLIQAALRGVAARLAAENATDEELAEIARVHKTSAPGAASPLGRAGELRHDLHQLIERASHNPSLIDMIGTAEAFGRSLRTRAQQDPAAAEGVERAVREHGEIIEALRARDGERAERLMREHELWIGRSYLEFIESHELARSRSDPHADA